MRGHWKSKEGAHSVIHRQNIAQRMSKTIVAYHLTWLYEAALPSMQSASPDFHSLLSIHTYNCKQEVLIWLCDHYIDEGMCFSEKILHINRFLLFGSHNRNNHHSPFCFSLRENSQLEAFLQRSDYPHAVISPLHLKELPYLKLELICILSFANHHLHTSVWVIILH